MIHKTPLLCFFDSIVDSVMQTDFLNEASNIDAYDQCSVI